MSVIEVCESLRELIYSRPYSVLYTSDVLQITAQWTAQQNLAQNRGQNVDPQRAGTRRVV